MERTLFVVLPIYNEDQVLEGLIKDIYANCAALGLKCRVVAVNDGSRDSSARIIEKITLAYPDLIAVHHEINRGLGETIRDGFELAAKFAEPNDLITRLDADATHDPIYFGSMIKAVDDGYDIVIASRFQKGGGQQGVPSNRAWISFCANLFFKIFYGLKGVEEYTCGFRMYRASIVKNAINFYGNKFIQLKELGFCCTVEKLLKLSLLGAKIIEVPFVLKYDEKKSESKMVFNTTTAGYLFMVILHHWPWGGWKAYVKSQKKRGVLFASSSSR